MYFASRSRTRFAFGPGSEVLILGVFRVVVDMGSSRKSVVSSRFLVLRRTNRRTSGRRIEELVATEEVGATTRRQHCSITARAHQEVEPAHRQVRIGILVSHRYTYLNHYSLP